MLDARRAALAGSAHADQLLDAASAVLESILATDSERATTWADHAFDALARRVFLAQYAAVEPYRAWCNHELAARGVALQDIRRWIDIPALPIAAFKQLRIAAFAPELDVAAWHSSGTTGDDVSRHALPCLQPYDASLRAGVRAALLPDHAHEPLTCVQLAPGARDAPHSSLSHMLDVIRLDMCADGGAWVDAAGQLDAAGAWNALDQLSRAGAPVVIVTTSFALVELLAKTADHPALALPRRSRIMDTGGYKGRTAEHPRAQLVELVGRRLGIPAEGCENEYGMSELSSQAWLGSVARWLGRALPVQVADERRWQPPWMRTRVVHPQTLEPVADGEAGALVHHDLANVWSCAAIRTEDAGVRRGDTYSLAGRLPGAEIRGCSLQVEDVWNR